MLKLASDLSEAPLDSLPLFDPSLAFKSPIVAEISELVSAVATSGRKTFVVPP